jgi:hypothetical protein
MKVRNGFVSNSSSSSFVILGLFTDLPSDCTMENTSIEDDLESLGLDDRFTDSFKKAYIEAGGDLYSVLESLGLENKANSEGEEFIGVWPNFSDDKKTVGELKQEVYEKLVKVFKKVDYSKITIHSGEYYEG